MGSCVACQQQAPAILHRALLTEVIPTAPSGGEEGEDASEGRGMAVEGLMHSLTHAQPLTQCPSQSWVVTGPWHWPDAHGVSFEGHFSTAAHHLLSSPRVKRPESTFLSMYLAISTS